MEAKRYGSVIMMVNGLRSTNLYFALLVTSARMGIWILLQYCLQLLSFRLYENNNLNLL